MMDMEYNRTSPFISNCLHYSSEFHPYVGEFSYFRTFVEIFMMRIVMVYPDNYESKIGFEDIRRLVKGRCISSLGTEKVERSTFCATKGEVERELGKLTDFTRFYGEDADYEENFFDVRDDLLHVRPERTYLEEVPLFNLKRSLETAGQLVHFFGEEAADGACKYPYLHAVAEGVQTFPDIVKRIDAVLNKYGKIKDTASSELLSIRHELEGVVRSISYSLRNIVREAQDEGYIDRNVSPTMRDGRLVIPVNPALKRKIKGIVHDESATGKTVFIEPAVVVEANNRVRELKAAEKREVIRILQEVTAQIRPHITDMIGTLLFLGEVDFVRAKMLFAQNIKAIVPNLVDEPYIEWHQAVHPLLRQSLDKQGKKEVVPLDIKLTPGQRILLISGPNAGGKSICLKTVGLLQYMVQCGYPVPLREDSKVGIFEHISLDIGDDQSIENDLSTYSSHLVHMKRMLDTCTARSLLLVDEFGSGTEPQLGGAIAEAILKRFVEGGAFGIITTHYQNLKVYAESHENIVNGAMLYDLQRLQPLFILQIGSPGSSFALEIARKIGLPESVMKEAAALVGQERIMSERYLQEINRDKRYWENKRQNIRKREKQIEELLQRYEAEMTQLREQRHDILARAREEADDLLKASNAKIEQTIRTIREAQAEKERTKAARRELEFFKEEMAEKDRENEERIARKIEQIKRRQQRNRDRKGGQDGPAAAVAGQGAGGADAKKAAGGPLHAGDTVRIKGQTGTGRIVSLQGLTARVLFGVMYTTVPLARLEAAEPARETDISRVVQAVYNSTRQTIDEKRSAFKTDVDLRGYRGDEAVDAVRHFIDDAIMLGVPRVRILHGTGTGALRQLIRQYLAVTPGVAAYRDEHVQLGGSGITVVDLA